MNVNCGPKMGRTAQPPLSLRSEHLDSWKQIAVYLSRAVRTVQRWEKYEGLPVHRHIHVKAGTVYASKKEIDLWLASRGRGTGEPRSMQKYSKNTANELNPPPHVTREMLSSFVLLLARIANEAYQDGSDVAVPDFRTPAGDPDALTQRPPTEREVCTRQLVTHRACRALLLASQHEGPRIRSGPQSH
jgi:hypothetical protein